MKLKRKIICLFAALCMIMALLPKGEQVRKALQAKKVYVPLLWPEAAAAEHDPVGRAYARNILPLPVDQRYTPEDMERMLAILTPLLG